MSMDYEELAKSVDNVRESLRALVAGLMEDGFTDEQARSLVVSMFQMFAKADDETEEEGPPEAYSCRCGGDPAHPRSERCGP